MAQIQKKFIAANAIDGTKIRLSNAELLRARNAANSADVNILKVNASDAIEFASVPQTTADAATGNGLVRLSQMQTADALAIPLTQKGANNGVATLDAGGKIPLGQLPASLMEYQGTWDASTNTPTLADGTGTSGFFYRVNVAGTQDLGSGPLTFVVSDWVMYDGAVWQLAHSGADVVISVNGQAGVVVLTTSDVAEGSNLYFTDERAQDSVGAMVASSSKVSLTYVDATPSLIADIIAGSLTNADVSASAAIDYTKLNLATSVQASDMDSQASTAGKVLTADGAGGATYASPAAAPTQLEEKITLTGTDITNQYVDLAHPIKGSSASVNSLSLFTIGGPIQEKTVDYTVSLTGGSGSVTRVTFAGDLATGGPAALISGDKLVLNYSY